MALGGNSGSSKASESAVKAGEAFYELNIQDTGAYKTLVRFGERLTKLGSTIRSVGAASAIGGSAILAPLVSVFKSAVEKSAEVKKSMDLLRASAEDVTALGYAAQKTGIEINDFTQATLKLNQAALSAEKGGIDQAVAFRQMGVEARQFMNLGLEQKYSSIASTFDKMSDPMEQTRFLFRLFGEDANKLLPLFAKGSMGISDLIQEANKLGITLNSDEVAKGNQLHKLFESTLKELKSTVLEVGFALFGFSGNIEDSAGILSTYLTNIRNWIKENQATIRIVAIAAGGLVAFGAAAIAVGTALSGLVAGIAAVKAIIATAIAIAFNPIILTLAAVTAGVYFAYNAFEDFRNLIGSITGYIQSKFEGIGETFQEMFGGIVAALKKGELQLAWEIMTTGLSLLWNQMMLGMKKAWNDFVKNVASFYVKNRGWLRFVSAGGVALIDLLSRGDLETAFTLDTSETEKRIERLKMELGKVVAIAKEAPKVVGNTAGLVWGAIFNPLMMHAIEEALLRAKADKIGGLGDAVRGTFGSSDYRGTLGIGPANQIAKKSYDVQKQIRDELIKLNKKPGIAFK